MNKLILTAFGMLATFSTPTFACLPPPPGAVEPPPPTKEERARQIFSWSTDIVYGAVTSDNDDKTRFKVIHVYKGDLRPGQVIEPRLSWGFDAPPCASMLGAPPSSPGQYGVIAFREEPELNFVNDGYLQQMFDAQWIVSARR